MTASRTATAVRSSCPCWLIWCFITADMQTSLFWCSFTRLRSEQIHARTHTHTRRQTHTQACTGHNNHEYFLPLHSSPWLEERGEGKYLFSLWSSDTRLEPELWRPWVSHTLKSVCDVCNQTAATPFRQTHTFAHVRLILPCVLSEGAASKRFGIDEEREAVPLTLSLAYNKVLFPHTRFLQHLE